MAAPSGQTSEIIEMSLNPAKTGQDVDSTAKSSSSSGSIHTTNGDEEHGMSTLERIKSKFGDRPECFKNTFQEISFIFQATIATATTSFLSGVALVITVPVSRDLGMTQGEIAWISAATSYV